MDDLLDDSFEAEEKRKKDEQAFKQSVLDYHGLINRVFSSEDGQRLLERWTKEQIFTPTVIAGQPLEAQGIREGKASFVRNIHEVLQMIENDYYQQEEQ